MLRPRDTHTHVELDAAMTSGKLNWLRAAVLGANDGIVSVSSVIVGVAGATDSTSAIVTAGVAAIVAGALSMAVGEYVSVSAQRDTEESLLKKEKHELATLPDQELRELALLYEKKGLSAVTASQVARELTAHDAFTAHAEAEHGLNSLELSNPWHAAYASGLAFLCGAIIPLVAIIFPPVSTRIPVTFASVIIALMITGSLSAYAGGAKIRKAILRVVVGGLIAMLVTYGIGKLFGVIGM